MKTISLIYISEDEGRINIIAYDSSDTAWKTSRQLEIDLRAAVIELCHDYKLIAMFSDRDHHVQNRAEGIIAKRLKMALSTIKAESVRNDLRRTCINLVSRNHNEIMEDVDCYEINEELSFHTMIVHSV